MYNIYIGVLRRLLTHQVSEGPLWRLFLMLLHNGNLIGLYSRKQEQRLSHATYQSTNKSINISDLGFTCFDSGNGNIVLSHLLKYFSSCWQLKMNDCFITYISLLLSESHLYKHIRHHKWSQQWVTPYLYIPLESLLSHPSTNKKQMSWENSKCQKHT